MKTIFPLQKAILGLLLVLFSTTGCDKDIPVPDMPELEEITGPCDDPDSVTGAIACAKCDTLNKLIRELPAYSNPAPVDRTESNAKEEHFTDDNKEWVCTYKDVKWAPEYNELYLLDPSDVIYEGSILDGGSILSGSYRPIVMERDSLVLSVSIAKSSGNQQRITVARPSLSTVREARSALLQQVVPNGTPALINYDMEKVYAKEDVELNLQANFHGWGAKVSASYDFARTHVQSRFLFRFWQVYYSVDVDPPTYPCEWFDPLPTKDRALEFFQGTMPVYVSSVRYGRMVYFMVESEKTEEEVEKALSVSYNRFGLGGGVDLSTEDKKVINESKITALIIGGPSESAIKAVSGVEGLKAYLEEGANFSPTSPGVPISYTLRFLDDNSVANVVLSSEYTVRQCAPKGEHVSLAPTPVAARYDGCPILTEGDEEFDNPAVKITGRITLRINQERNAVIAKIFFKFNEPSPDSHPKDTRAELTDEIVAYELKDPNKYIANILTEEESTIDFTPSRHGNHEPPFTAEFIRKIILQADGSGDDLPCMGYTETGDWAFVRILFGKLKVNVVSR